MNELSPTATGIVYLPNDGNDPGPLIAVDFGADPAWGSLVATYRNGAELQLIFDPGWVGQKTPTGPQVLLGCKAGASLVDLGLRFDTADPDHTIALVDALNYKMIYLTDPDTFAAVKEDGQADKEVDYGRLIFGWPSAAISLQQALSTLGLSIPSAN